LENLFRSPSKAGFTFNVSTLAIIAFELASKKSAVSVQTVLNVQSSFTGIKAGFYTLKQKDLSTRLTVKGFKSTAVSGISLVHGVSIEITLTVPLRMNGHIVPQSL